MPFSSTSVLPSPRLPGGSSPNILIILYVLSNVVPNLWKTLSMFLQGLPEDIEVERVQEALTALPNVCEAHDTHVWTLDGGSHVLTTHLVADEASQSWRKNRSRRRPAGAYWTMASFILRLK